MRRRTEHAVSLLQSGEASLLVLTGGVGAHAPSEAEVMAEVALAAGAARSQLVLEREASNTFQNAALASRILRERGHSSAIVVTDAFHVTRTRLFFHAYGIRTRASIAPIDPHAIRPLRRLRIRSREALALPWALIQYASVRIGLVR